jgi:hypothetical protein
VIRNVEGLEDGHCPHCNAKVKLVPHNRDAKKVYCIECLKPVNY